MLEYPDGVLVEDDEQIYRVSGKSLIPLISWSAVVSWGQPILVAQKDIISDYVISPAVLGFRPGSVLESFTTGQKYFIADGKKRLITNPAFWELGFNDFETILVSDAELEIHKDGEPIV